MRRRLYLSALLIPTAVLLGARANARVVTSAADLSSALLGDNIVGTGFDLRAHVSRACSSTNSALGVWDDSGAVLLTHECRECDNRIRVGDRIHVAGYADYTSNGFVMTVITNLNILAHGDPPPVTEVRTGEIDSGRYDHRLVRLSGVLADIQTDDVDANNLFLALHSDGETVIANASPKWNENGGLDALLGRKVTITGMLVLPELSWRRLNGRSVSIYDRDGILPTVQDEDRFAAPFLSETPSRTPTAVSKLGQRRVDGTVLAVWDKRNVVLLTDAGTTRQIALFKAPPPEVGQRIEAVGFPQTDLFAISLARAAWRPSNHAPVSIPPPVVTDLRYCLSDPEGHPRVNMSLAGRSVRLTGRLLGGRTSDSDDLLLEQDGRRLLVNTRSLVRLPAGVREDADVEMTGVFVVRTGVWTDSTSLPKVNEAMLVLRTADDIRVLRPAPFWTSARLLSITLPLLLLLIVQIVRSHVIRVRAELKARERTRIAVELHDSLSQTLAAVSMEIAAANALKGDAPADMIRHLNVAGRTLHSCRSELRNCLWDLRSAALDKPDMAQAILTTLRPHVNDGRLAVRFNVPRTRVPDNIAHAVLRIVRELVLNALRHGKATVVRVAGCLDGNKLRFSVTDDGCGFDPNDRPDVTEGHFGLQGIQERLDGLAGTMTVLSTIGRGTHVRVSVPTGNTPD